MILIIFLVDVYMYCPNCHSQVPNTANVYGYCGTNLRTVPVKSGMSG